MSRDNPLKGLFLKHSEHLRSVLGEREWISAEDFASKAGISGIRARTLLRQGRIPNAKKVGAGRMKLWLVPADAVWRPKKVGRPGIPNDEKRFIKILNKAGPPNNWTRTPRRNFGKWLFENKPKMFTKRYKAWLGRIERGRQKREIRRAWAIANKAWIKESELTRTCGFCGHTHDKLPFFRDESFYYCDCCGCEIFKPIKGYDHKMP